MRSSAMSEELLDGFRVVPYRVFLQVLVTLAATPGQTISE